MENRDKLIHLNLDLHRCWNDSKSLYILGCAGTMIDIADHIKEAMSLLGSVLQEVRHGEVVEEMARVEQTTAANRPR